MKTKLIIIALLYISLLFAQEEYLNPKLEMFKPYINKTYKGTFQNDGQDKLTIDISRWERALNGNAIKTIHSLNNGEYGGESIIFWNNEKNSLVYYYFTTAGFYTSGSMTFADDKIIAHELVKNNQNGITEVKSESNLLPDGRLHTKSFYLKNGEWINGHEIIYVEDLESKVIFK